MGPAGPARDGRARYLGLPSDDLTMRIPADPSTPEVGLPSAASALPQELTHE